MMEIVLDPVYIANKDIVNPNANLTVNQTPVF